VAGDLPPELKAMIAARLEGVSRKELAARAQKLSDHYRAGGASGPVVSDVADVTAYLVSRLPATFAAVAAALRETRLAAPVFEPARLLDIGAGPGTASFAVVAEWPEIASIIMIDGSRHFINAAGELAAASAHPALANSTRVMADVTRFGRDLPTADIVLAAYVLAEIREADADTFLAQVWQACHGVLVLVEPGTPAGFERIRRARAALIAAGASIVAPCPHGLACPIVGPDWCHFAERLNRSRDHRLAKTADAPFEDEKFSYVVAARPSVMVAPYDARVLAPPKSSKSEMRLKLCTTEGVIAERVIPRREREAYGRLRRAWWGDAVANGAPIHSASGGSGPGNAGQ